MKTRRLKVLLGCYACNPFQGSEPGTGWNFVVNIAKHHDVHAIVEEEVGKDDILKYLKQNPDSLKNVTFHFIKRRRCRLLRKIWPPSYYWSYRLWQKKAYKYALELDKQEDFDIVHQINLVGYREPGYLWKINKPFIWGPVGGLNQTAWNLLPFMSLYGIVFYTMRNLINKVHKRWSIAAQKASQKAHTIFASDPETIHDIKKFWKRDAIVMREVGTSSSISATKISPRKPGSPLQICWAGVHEPRKGLPILLRAVALCKQNVHIHILGQGPCFRKWKNIARNLQVENIVTFHGKIPHDDVYNIMSKSHVFCITSISEGGTPNIVMEALQQGLPIVALNHCAYSSVIDNSCAIKIDIHPARTIIPQIANALDFLAESEETRQKLAHGALNRSQAYTWASKMEVLNAVYAQATNN